MHGTAVIAQFPDKNDPWFLQDRSEFQQYAKFCHKSLYAVAESAYKALGRYGRHYDIKITLQIKTVINIWLAMQREGLTYREEVLFNQLQEWEKEAEQEIGWPNI